MASKKDTTENLAAAHQTQPSLFSASPTRPVSAADIIQGLVDLYWKEQCIHEDTYRGGTIWTICRACGQKWADDEGGFKPHVAPDLVLQAEEWLRGQSVRGEDLHDHPGRLSGD